MALFLWTLFLLTVAEIIYFNLAKVVILTLLGAGAIFLLICIILAFEGNGSGNQEAQAGARAAAGGRIGAGSAAKACRASESTGDHRRARTDCGGRRSGDGLRASGTAPIGRVGQKARRVSPASLASRCVNKRVPNDDGI